MGGRNLFLRAPSNPDVDIARPRGRKRISLVTAPPITDLSEG